MREFIAVIMALLICMSLASCSKSVGIIGGADGETEIYVGEIK